MPPLCSIRLKVYKGSPSIVEHLPACQMLNKCSGMLSNVQQCATNAQIYHQMLGNIQQMLNKYSTVLCKFLAPNKKEFKGSSILDSFFKENSLPYCAKALSSLIILQFSSKRNPIHWVKVSTFWTMLNHVLALYL